MTPSAAFKAAAPYQDVILGLPVADIDAAAAWYSEKFGMREVERWDQPTPAVVLEREGIQIGFAANGRDPSQDGAALQVANISAMRDELESKGVQTANWRIDERDGQQLQVFFVVAPDGLCYYFYEPIARGSGAGSTS
jgi:catechol 2,3-dioxygenase-like lactoylglutathione lyase family enzyme